MYVGQITQIGYIQHKTIFRDNLVYLNVLLTDLFLLFSPQQIQHTEN